MATVLFVHGTGVRKAGYLSNFALVRDALQTYGPAHALEPCLWGDDLGSRHPSLSLPTLQGPARVLSSPASRRLPGGGCCMSVHFSDCAY